MTGSTQGTSGRGRPFSPPVRAAMLLLLLGLVTGLVEGGYLALQQRLFHHITFATSDALWMAPVAYTILFALTAVPVALLAWLAPRRITTAVVLCIGIALLCFSLLSLWLGLRLNVLSLGLLSLGAGVQLGRLLGPFAERQERRLLLLTGVLLTVVGAVAGTAVAQYRWPRSAGATSGSAASAAAPNVLLIILDTVRAASLDLYGYDRPTSPHLTEFARGGVTFDSAYSISSWTLPSHGSMFTGLYHQDITTDWLTPLDAAPRTLAEAFAAGGYATAGFVGNLTYTSRESGLARGFQTYRDYKLTRSQLFNSATLYGVTRDLLLHASRVRRAHDRKEGPRVTAEFLKWMDQRRPDRFFVFLNYFDAHLPRTTVRSGHEWHSGRWEMDGYDAAIARTDKFVGDLLDSLAARGVLERTLVVIASDHGTLIGEHNLHGHGNALYNRLLHVPLVVRGPGVPAGRRVSTPVSLRDLAETVRQAAGLVEQAPFPGTSLGPLWQDQPGAPVSPLLAQVTKGVLTPPNDPVTLGTMTSVILNGDHYILGGLGREEFFRLGTDPGEEHDLAADTAYQTALDAARDWMRDLKRPGWAGAPDVPPKGTPGGEGP